MDKRLPFAREFNYTTEESEATLYLNRVPVDAENALQLFDSLDGAGLGFEPNLNFPQHSISLQIHYQSFGYCSK